MKEVFKAIEKNSEYVVFYYDGVVDVNRKVTIQAENKTVDQILDELFAGTPNIYEIKDRQIVISKKILPQEQQPQIKRITGKVVDEKGLVMPGATIQIEGTSGTMWMVLLP
ncbi:MAG: STN domain-containing protein [Odoribacter splanchnicus]